MEEDSQNDFDYDEYDQSDRNESDFLSSSWDEEISSHEDEEKKNLLIHKILDDRKNSLKKIKKFFCFCKKINSARILLVNILLEKRESNSIIIQRCFRYYQKRKLLQEIFQKEESNFSIVCSIKYVKQIDLKVYLPDDQVRFFHFDFCKLRNYFVLYIPRKLCKNRVFKVNFIADGKIVIDLMYKADYDLSYTGMFYNIIDFNKIENFEKNQKEDKERILEYHRDKYRKKNEMLMKHKHNFYCSSSDSEEENLECKEKSSSKKKKNSDLMLKISSSENFSRKSSITPHSAFQLAKLGFSKNHRNSCIFSSPLKSILRSPTSSRNNIPKRVSFCDSNVNVK